MTKCKGSNEDGSVCGRPSMYKSDYCRGHRTQDPSVNICRGKMGDGRPCFREAMTGALFCRGHRTQLGDLEKLQCPRGCGQLIYRSEYKNGYYYCQECKGTMLDAKSVEKEISKHAETLKNLLGNGKKCSLRCPRCEGLMLEIRVVYEMPKGGGGGLGNIGPVGHPGALIGILLIVVVVAAISAAAESKKKRSEDENDEFTGPNMVIDGCRDCGTFWFDAKEMRTIKQSTSVEGEEVEIARTKAESGEKKNAIGSYAIGNCLYIDDLTDKKCRRVTFRGTEYCYAHQPE